MADAIDDLFRRFGKAFNKADVEEIAACVTDDFEWRLNAGGAPAGRVLKGKDGLRAHFADKIQGASRGALFRGPHPSRRRQTVRHLPRHRHRPCRQAPSTATASTSTR